MDWKKTIAEIQRLGQMTQTQIADRAGCGQATVSDLAKGLTKQPNYALGCALLKILEEFKPELAQSPADTAQPATEVVANQGA